MLEQLTIDDFSPYVNKEISIQFTPDVKLAATLVKVNSWGEKTDQHRQPFTLEFRTAQKNEYYPQGMFTILHPEAGELPVFLVPIGPDEEGMIYQAVFN